MKHPFWILNSALLFLLLSALLFIFFSRQPMPSRQSIKPDTHGEAVVRDVSQISIEKIYENDLFDTYQKEFPAVVKSDVKIPMPPPPTPQPTYIPEKPKVQFLDPLPVTLHGIMIISSDDSKNRAIIEDNKTGTEKTYKVGDMIEDAQLIRIFSNKIILIRSNGQQEVLYMREKDARLDPLYANITGWDDVIQKISEYRYIINTESFTERVPSLGQLIDLLDLVTVYKQGKNIGCRVGHLEENSLGLALGLQKGDIIIQINGIPADTTAHRFAIYKSVLSTKGNGTVQVIILRNKQEIAFNYVLERNGAIKSDSSTAITPETLEKEHMKIMQEKYTFAPTMKKIRETEKEKMRTQGLRPSGVK